MEYTQVKLCTYQNDLSKPWFVSFECTDTELGITVRKQFRGGINYYGDVESRTKKGLELKKYWENQLENGWSPFDKKESEAEGSLSSMRLNKALDWALARCNVASKTKLDYACPVRFFQQAAKKLGLDSALVNKITRRHVLLILDQITKDRGWSHHAYNKNTGYIRAVFRILVKYLIIPYNPASKIDPLPDTERNFFVPFTPAEKKKLKKELPSIHPNYFIYLMLVYHTGIRPKEALALKIPDIHLTEDSIEITPDLDAENSKTKKRRIVPLNAHIKELLARHLKKKYPSDYYVFGRPTAASTSSANPNYFTPSPYHIKRDTATKLYKKLVWNGLGIHKYQYALKHTGADDKILAGVPLDALRSMYGHTSKRMTERYAKQIKKVYAKEITEKSPDF